MPRVIVSICCALALGVPARAQAPTPDNVVTHIKASAGFEAATRFLDGDHERFVRELVTLTEIPAPPFKEDARGAAYLAMLRDAGLTDVERDMEGNTMGVWRGASPAGGPMLAVLAHLDTVFPERTDVRVKRAGTRLAAPGIGDDTRGLALMLTVIRAMRAANVKTRDDILFVGNVGEEGEGDLRGVKYLLSKGKYRSRIRQFISIDGGDQKFIANVAVGSLRYRVTFKGPGGHSYGAFGLVNPSFAMGDAIQRFSRIQVPSMPKTTFNVGVVSGGTSVNSIPVEVNMDVDMRSESPAELKKLDAAFKQVVSSAVDAENKARSTAQGPIVADVKLIGDRPSGSTSPETALLRTISSAVRSFGMTPIYQASSTDSNYPISLGIPAATIGKGGAGEGRAHSLDEWTDVEKSAAVKAGQVTLTIIWAAAGVP